MEKPPSLSGASLPPRPTGLTSTLPPKPSLPQRSGAHPVPSSSRHEAVSGSGGLLKFVVFFLFILTLGNLGLTIYYNQPKPDAADYPGMAATIQRQQTDIDGLKKEIESLESKLANSKTAIDRLRADHVGLSGRVGAINNPKPLPYATELKTPEKEAPK